MRRDSFYGLLIVHEIFGAALDFAVSLYYPIVDPIARLRNSTTLSGYSRQN